jgi:integrase
MAVQEHFPGLEPRVGDRHAVDVLQLYSDDIPKERSGIRKNSRECGRVRVMQPDLFQDGEVQPAVEIGGPALPGDNIAETNAKLTTELDLSIADLDRLGVIDPTSIDLPENARVRLAGDIVVGEMPPATFAEAITILAASNTLRDKQLSSLRNDVDWIETRRPRQGNGSSPDPLPCNPELLRAILNEIRLGQYKISKKRWSNIKWSLTAIQRKTGWLPPKLPRVAINSPEWAAVLGFMGDDPGRSMMRAFAVFCQARGVGPQAVKREHLAQYADALRKTPAKAPDLTADTIRYRWNRLARQFANFPGIEISATRNPHFIRDERHAIPASFEADLDAYISVLRKPGRFMPGFSRPAAENTIRTRKGILALAPHRLVGRGWEAASLHSLGSVLTPAAVEAVLNDYADANCSEGNWTLGAEATAQALMIAARQWGRLPPADLDRVVEICRSVKAPHRGFSKKKLERLAQFDDPKVERRFLELPESMWAKAKHLEKNGKIKRAADMAKYAVALAILFDKPLRVGDLSILDLAQDFARDTKGRISGIKIAIGRASKRAPVVEGALSRETVKMIDSFVSRFRPVLVHFESTALFPGKLGGHNRSQSMATQIKKVIGRELGIDVNSHLIRAFVGTMILDEDPRAIALAQGVLGHRERSTTARFYAVQRGRAVNRGYAELLERRRRRLKQS